MHIRLSGHLNWYEKDKRSSFDVDLAGQSRMVDLLEKLGIPPGEIAIVLINGEPVPLQDAAVDDGDEVKLFPPSSGG